jgi:hypothetical protein
MLLTTSARWLAVGFIAGGVLSFQHVYHLVDDNSKEVSLRLDALRHLTDSHAELLKARAAVVVQQRQSKSSPTGNPV